MAQRRRRRRKKKKKKKKEEEEEKEKYRGNTLLNLLRYFVQVGPLKCEMNWMVSFHKPSIFFFREACPQEFAQLDIQIIPIESVVGFFSLS